MWGLVGLLVRKCSTRLEGVTSTPFLSPLVDATRSDNGGDGLAEEGQVGGTNDSSSSDESGGKEKEKAPEGK